MQADADDAVTVWSIAVLSACVATIAHEAVGHGSACLLLGGTITRLTSVYFRCSARSLWVAAGGPLGNLAAFAIACAGFSLVPTRMARMKLFLLLLAAISIFWFAGYLIYSAVLNDGDFYFVATDLLGKPSLPIRAGSAVFGVGLYELGIRVTRSFAGQLTQDTACARRLLMQSWLAASLSACIAALAYAPDPLLATRQAALEIGAACLPMLGRMMAGPARAGPYATKIERSWIWIGASLSGFAIFVATLGRGMSA